MIPATGRSVSFAADSHGVDALRFQARKNPEQAARGAAQQFEALFLQTLLKTMRDAAPQDGLMDSEQTRMYTSMLDQQLAQNLSAKGIGLADVMLRQLLRNQAAAVGAGAGAVPLPVDGNSPRVEAAAGPKQNAGGANAVLPQAGGDFILRMKQHALEASVATGVPARFLLGHAALESGWGKHEIRNSDGSQSFNLFGIKAGRNWRGSTADVVTTEYVDGVPHKTLQKFRAYGSYAEGFHDYARVLRENPRYVLVLKQNDGAGFAQGLQRAGYATDPNYADKLTRVLNGARLRQTLAA